MYVKLILQFLLKKLTMTSLKNLQANLSEVKMDVLSGSQMMKVKGGWGGGYNNGGHSHKGSHKGSHKKSHKGSGHNGGYGGGYGGGCGCGH